MKCYTDIWTQKFRIQRQYIRLILKEHKVSRPGSLHVSGMVLNNSLSLTTVRFSYCQMATKTIIGVRMR